MKTIFLNFPELDEALKEAKKLSNKTLTKQLRAAKSREEIWDIFSKLDLQCDENDSSSSKPSTNSVQQASHTQAAN